jgi:aminoglycoside phosphotransferase (APT) family kinase protein
MHVGEQPTDPGLVRALLEQQFPDWAALRIERVASTGTDNALYRLGEDMVVRLPRIEWVTSGIDKDFQWLPTLAPQLPVAIPTPLERGRPGAGYPWEWGIYSWLPGENPALGGGGAELALDLARFVRELISVDTAGAPASRRGRPLATQDERARQALAEVPEAIDAWDAALAVPEWEGRPVWLHADLLPGNLLVGEGGTLAAVIDFAVAGVGDPACDLIPAWSVLTGEARQIFRSEVGFDDATWRRGRGWALSIGLIALPYYRETNPGFAAVARHMIDEVLADANIRS